MPEPILDTDYWRERLLQAQKGELHHAIFKCEKQHWLAIEAKHRQILLNHVGWKTSVLDCGCGWGRLLDMMPPGWLGDYLGIDLSPEFIALARERHKRHFIIGSLLEMPHHICPVGEKFNLAVLVSIRPMVKRNLGDEVWMAMEAQIRKVSAKLLYLEYDPNDEGSLE